MAGRHTKKRGTLVDAAPELGTNADQTVELALAPERRPSDTVPEGLPVAGQPATRGLATRWRTAAATSAGIAALAAAAGLLLLTGSDSAARQDFPQPVLRATPSTAEPSSDDEHHARSTPPEAPRRHYPAPQPRPTTRKPSPTPSESRTPPETPRPHPTPTASPSSPSPTPTDTDDDGWPWPPYSPEER